jgi:hypothetical protein
MQLKQEVVCEEYVAGQMLNLLTTVLLAVCARTKCACRMELVAYVAFKFEVESRGQCATSWWSFTVMRIMVFYILHYISSRIRISSR